MMEQKYYAMIGHCKMAKGLQEGVSVFEYDPATAAMTHVGDYARHLRVGAQTYDAKRKMLYAVDEFWSLDGTTGGGGHVASLKLEEASGHLEQTSIQRTFGTNPSYVTQDKTGKYLLVTHHGQPHYVNRLIKTENGYTGEICYNCCTLLLYRVEENGDIGPIVDAFEVNGFNQDGEYRFPHLHCVVPDQEKNYYIVCDKGLDKVYSFKIDYENEKIVKCGEVDGKPHSAPRYCNFHPTKPIFYSNCEDSVDVNVYELNKENGQFHLLGTCESVPEELREDISPSDVVVHPNGKYVFTSLRTRNLISVLEIVDDRTLALRQTLSCGGVNPRGLCVSPDGRFLLAANMQTEAVNAFAIGADGQLTPAGSTHTGGFPGNIQIIGAQAGG